ncbi:DUF3572 domain-containing protein [Kordiimonas pumila]|uniref:DUF3572 domain-containing protein n=1 Tax=Kordiimonas pumila TaxID=2161677 RepID=A0ABV7D1G2_9PROT|nr:DUF3572 domain-containing protein [Kordiimonas pumila]
MQQQDTTTAHTIALEAISYIFSEGYLRDRFFALTGLSPEGMRASLEDPHFLSSTLGFLIDHEPDLLAFAAFIEKKPESIVIAWRTLGGGQGQEW